MDEKSQQLLDSILKKNPEDLTPEDRGFLKARESYLTNDQKRIFTSILEVKENTPVEEKVAEPVVAPEVKRPRGWNLRKENQTPSSSTPADEVGQAESAGVKEDVV